LFDGVAEIDRVIASRGLDPVRTKGQIGMNAGLFLAIVFSDTPDDPVRIDKLK